MKRILFFLAVFILPIAIFLFLKYFGKNEFDIPVFYKDSSPENTNCPFGYKAPYKIPDSVMQVLQARKSASYLILDSVVFDKNLISLQEKFTPSELKVIRMNSDRIQEGLVKDCIFFLVSPNNAVLIDSVKQIRGYYALPKREEMDKLEVELNVLLKKY